MSSLGKKILSTEEINKLSSVYLNEGIKQEGWEITHVEIEGNILTARIRMKSQYVSPTDTSGFHLTIFSTLEFLSQLTIIYAHVWAGLTEKTREGWMIECSVTSGQTIRDPNNIEVNMEVISIKKVGENILAVTKSRVFDSTGQFEARLKGFLS
jgi:hypothetical protein